jgi:hypothetical protein
MIHSNSDFILFSVGAFRRFALTAALALLLPAPSVVQARYLTTDWTITQDEWPNPAYIYSISNSATVTVRNGASWNLMDDWTYIYQPIYIGGQITGSGNPGANFTGNLSILEAGRLESAGGEIGGFGNGIGNVLVSGPGSSWTVHGPTSTGGNSEPGGSSAETDWASIYVGSWAGGFGTLTVSNGAVVSPGQTYPYGAIGTGKLLGPGVYVGYHPEALLSAPYFRSDAGTGTLAGDGGNIHGNTFIGKTGTLSPGATNVTNPNSSAAIGTLNITGGANLSLIGGRLDLDISSVAAGDKIVMSNAGTVVTGGSSSVTFNEVEGKVTVFLRLSDDVLNAGYFDVEVIAGASSILGFTDLSKIQIVSDTTGWDFWTTTETTGSTSGFIHGLQQNNPGGGGIGGGAGIVPEPVTYATFGSGLLVSLVIARRYWRMRLAAAKRGRA